MANTRESAHQVALIYLIIFVIINILVIKVHISLRLLYAI